MVVRTCVLRDLQPGRCTISDCNSRRRSTMHWSRSCGKSQIGALVENHMSACNLWWHSYHYTFDTATAGHSAKYSSHIRPSDHKAALCCWEMRTPCWFRTKPKRSLLNTLPVPSSWSIIGTENPKHDVVRTIVRWRPPRCVLPRQLCGRLAHTSSDLDACIGEC